LDANKAREEITKMGFDAFDPINTELGDEAYRIAFSDYSEGKYASAKNKAEEALMIYNQVLKAGYEAAAGEKSASAAAARQKALDEKANIAAKQEFDSADSIFALANTALRGQKYDEAVNLFMDCEPMFLEAADFARTKRLAAEEAMRRANQKVAESQEIAESAEQAVEGGAE
jgi:hypothetical protein